MPAGRLLLAALAALALAPAHAAHAQSSGRPSPTRESASPIEDQGSSYHYRSYITRVAPSTPGLSLQVLEFADRLLLGNRTGRTVTVEGYEGEPYARVLADGTVELNTRSPAYYLNQSFYANVTVPAAASAKAPPRWSVIDRTGQLEWHDHRIHWMSPVAPPQVKDKRRRTKIFDWQVPILVGAQKGAVDGQLFWVPATGSKAPTAAIVALAAIMIGGLALVIVARRRRGRSARGPTREAW